LAPGGAGHANPMETPQESGAGYPEEQPAEVASDPQDESPVRKGGQADHSGAPAYDDGTATGNPKDAGSEEPPEERAPGR